MIDTLLANQHRFKKPKLWDEEGLEKDKYFVVTLHRPSNVDNGLKIMNILETIVESAK